jgi:hypothetical protein
MVIAKVRFPSATLLSQYIGIVECHEGLHTRIIVVSSRVEWPRHIAAIPA